MILILKITYSKQKGIANYYSFCFMHLKYPLLRNLYPGYDNKKTFATFSNALELAKTSSDKKIFTKNIEQLRSKN